MNKVIQSMLFLAFLASGTSFAQTYFNKTYHIDSLVTSIQEVFEVADGYIGVGNIIDTAGIFILKVDSQGNYLHHKNLFFTNEYVMCGSASFVAQKSNDNYVLGLTGTNGNQRYGMVAELGPNFDTLWVKRFTFQYEVQVSNILVDSLDKIYITGGSRDSSDFGPKIFLAKLTASGNLLWHKNPVNLHSGALNFLLSPDGGFLISGSYSYNNLYTHAPYILKVDSAGNFQWNTLLAYGAKAGRGYASYAKNGDILFSASVSWDEIYFDGYIARLNPSGSIIWQDTFSRSFSAGFSSRPIEFNNKNILVNGYTGGKSWLVCLSPGGDSLWSKDIETPSQIYGETYYINKVSDGGFIISGTALNQFSEQESWLIKTDSGGCTTSNCSSVSVGQDVANNTISLYPNPGKDWISVEGEAGLFPGILRLYNLEGRELLHCEVHKGVPVDTRYIERGMYRWVLTDLRGNLFLGNWIKLD